MTISMPTEGEHGVSCPKCGHACPSAALVCAQCGRHLRVYCHHCGGLNHRAAERCEHCRSRLRHRSTPRPPPVHRHLWPAAWRQRRSRPWLLPTQIAVFVTLVLLTVGAIIRLAEYDPPKPQDQGDTVPSPQPAVYRFK